MTTKHYLFDWGNTLMVDNPNYSGPMCDWPRLDVIAGAKTYVERLSQQGQCHLATNARDSGLNQIRQALQKAGLNAYIDQVFCYENLGCGKNDTHYFHAILRHLDVTASDVTMIGDSLENDIYPALSAGLKALWYNPHRHPIPIALASHVHFGEVGAFI